MELVIILVIPLIVAALSLVPTKKATLASGLTTLGAALIFLLCLHTIWDLGQGKEVIVLGLDGWLSCDGLSGLIMLLVSFVGFTAALFSWGYIEQGTGAEGMRKARRYYFQYNLFLLSMLAVPLLAQVALVWIAVELTTLLSVFLVGFENRAEALEAAWKYVVLTCMGAALALMGVLILYWGLTLSGGDGFTWSGLLAASPRIPPVFLKIAFLFILVGFGTKAGLVPMHTWLPDAHSQAPSPVCALLSGVETTTALYVIIRLLPLFQGVSVQSASTWLIVFGLISTGTAAFLLIQVRDYKRLFAFSTIEHMGIILVAAGLGQAVHLGAVYQILTHAVTKSFCFFAAGLVLLITGRREMSSVRGLVRISPLTGVSLMVAGLAIAGAPPFAVFLSELSIIKAGIAAGQYWVIGGLTLFIIIAFCGIMYQVNRMVFGQHLDSPGLPTVPLACKLAILLAVIPVVVLGLYLPQPLNNLMRFAALALGR